jgi:hypothetical protein
MHIHAFDLYVYAGALLWCRVFAGTLFLWLLESSRFLFLLVCEIHIFDLFSTTTPLLSCRLSGSRARSSLHGSCHVAESNNTCKLECYVVQKKME